MSPQHQDQALADAICWQLASAVSRPVGSASSTDSTEPVTEGWHIRIAVTRRGVADVWLACSAKDALAITNRILGSEGVEPAEGVVRDTLRELAAQAISAVKQEPLGAGLDIRVQAVEPSLAGVPAVPARMWAFDIGDGSSITIGAWCSPRAEEDASNGRSRRQRARNEASLDQLSESENIDLVLDIDLPMSVRFGKTEMALGSLTHLGPGSVIDLGRAPDEPVEMLVSGRVVARGDVVVIGGNFGVRVTDVYASAARRD
jgi:flagellar motor switch protein FliN